MNNDPPDRSEARFVVEHSACLGLGSNLDPGLHLRRALRWLRRVVRVEAVSTAWESPAVGSNNGPDYVNAALVVRTLLSKEGLTARLKRIEDTLGRVRASGQSARLTIDIDLVVFDGEVLEDDLWSQVYRAMPVAELLPDLNCPSTGEPLFRVAARLAGASPIRPRPDIFPRPPQSKATKLRYHD